MGDGDADAKSAELAHDDVRLDDARNRLWRTDPDASAAQLFTPAQLKWLFLLAVGLGTAVLLYPGTVWPCLSWLCSAFFCATILFRIFAGAACVGWKAPPIGTWREPLPTYTILCPLRGESTVVAQLIAALSSLRYPTAQLDVKLVLEADDPETRAAVATHLLPAHFEVLRVPVSLPRTKPKAINYALASARGDFVTVYDAEDRPHPDQLLRALDAFAVGGPRMGAVQAPLLIHNAGASWISRQFGAEYALQFLGAVPLLTHVGLPPPLGGTSNHFRREALEQVDGWDPYNVAEDADLGFRLARRGWRVGAIAAPTEEEAPTRVGQWVNQRSRWIKGYLQTWIVLMRRPSKALADLGPPSFLAAQIILLGGSFSALLHLPFTLLLLLAALSGQAPAASWILCIAGAASGLLTSLQAAAAARDLRLVAAAFTAPIYWFLGFPAALKALYGLVLRPHYWEKTAHGASAPRL